MRRRSSVGEAPGGGWDPGRRLGERAPAFLLAQVGALLLPSNFPLPTVTVGLTLWPQSPGSLCFGVGSKHTEI
ncbi:MAG: hypothetical protein M0033_01175, partial [Nitrospiraceae bacterium]|nr:hypothetical protein [Nitrospiraceae bacterium]